MIIENDVVQIYLEDEPLSFARIEKISPDIKAGWYHVKLLLLQLPLQAVTWILRDTYIDGGEFTMGGKKMRLEPVICPHDPAEQDPLDETTDEKDQNAAESDKSKVISLSDLKSKKS
ncbi:hypothetical protein ACFL7E_02045 [Thermodesulfobacteriota bacterium]